MKQNGIGGANTKTGLIFEGKTDLKTFLNSQKDYFVNENDEVFYKNESVAFIFKKHKLYKFLEFLHIFLRKIFAFCRISCYYIFVLLCSIMCKF